MIPPVRAALPPLLLLVAVALAPTAARAQDAELDEDTSEAVDDEVPSAEPAPESPPDDRPASLEFVNAIAFGPNLLKGPSATAWGIAAAGGFGVRVELDRTLSVPILLEARYVLGLSENLKRLLIFTPNIGLEMAFGEHRLAVAAGLSLWTGGMAVGDPPGSGKSGLAASSDRGLHLGVRYGHAGLVVGAGVEFIGAVTAGHLEIGVGL